MNGFDIEDWRNIRFYLKSNIVGKIHELEDIANTLKITEDTLYGYLFNEKIPQEFHYRKIKAYYFSCKYRENHVEKFEKLKVLNDHQFWIEESKNKMEKSTTKLKKMDDNLSR